MKRTLVLIVLAAGCSRGRRAPRPATRAEFGVLFGGQIEQRKEIPFTLDRNKQAQGFRVEFGAPLHASHRISWKLELPGFVHDKHGHLHRAHDPRTGQAEVRAGAREYDHEIAFSPGDPLGMWNIRVMVDDKIVLDRPFVVFNAEARKRRLERLRDGGT